MSRMLYDKTDRARFTTPTKTCPQTEQLRLHVQQRVVATADDSVLRTEMADLEPQEEDSPKRDLWFKSMS